MLQNKDITKIQELKTLFKDSWITPEFFSKQIELFHFTKASVIFKTVKQNGFPAWDLLKVLFILPFTNVQSVHSLYTTKIAPDTASKKDTYYRLLSNQKLNWRSILFLFVKRYLKLEDKFTPTENIHKCLIFDDTEIGKTGKHIEGVSKIHSHVSQTYIFGYKLLVAGYWDGSVFIPIDFSFHRESKNSKKGKYGLSIKEYKTQKKTKRDKGSPVLKRFKELNSKKNDVIIQMYKRILQRRIEVDYILIDSWFTSVSLVSKFLKINSKVNIIGMYKHNSKVNLNSKTRTIKQIRKSKNGLKRSKKTGFYYMSLIGEIKGVKLKIFLTRRGKNGAWHTIVSTDTGLTFNKMIEIYNIRWSIEVFFKEAKQLLNLGRNQSTNFDVQIAQTTITMIQYLMLSLKYRTEAYQTINGLFKDVKQDYIEHKLNERIWELIFDILSVLEVLGVMFDYEETISRLISYKKEMNAEKKNEELITFCKLTA